MLTEEVKIVNWINQFQHTIAYIENHLLEDIQVADIVKELSKSDMVSILHMRGEA